MFLFILIAVGIFFISFVLLNVYVQAEANNLRCGTGSHCSIDEAIQTLID